MTLQTESEEKILMSTHPRSINFYISDYEDDLARRLKRSTCLYVARGSKGMLKVGATKDPLKRLYGLRTIFADFGEEIVKFAHTDHLPYEDTEAEWRLVRSLNRQGLEQVHGREWFRGGDFDATMQLAHALKAEWEQEYIDMFARCLSRFGYEVRKIP